MAAAVVVILLIVSHFNEQPASALLGFDCGGHQLNVTTISLLGAAECDLKMTTPQKEDVYIQLLQLSEYNYATVIQCKVEVHRVAQYCGMHHHISAVRGGEASFMEETLRERCQQMHEHGVIRFGNTEDNIIKGLEINKTNYRTVMLGGTLTFDGKCKGIQYQDPYGIYQDVVVQATVKITLKQTRAPIQLEKGEIILKSGTRCDLGKGYCIDSDDGYSFWTPIPVSACDFHQYDVLYQGEAVKMRDTSQQHQPTVYSLTTDEIVFALTTKKQHPICGYALWQTEHPKLFIVETTKENIVKIQKQIPVDNLDIFTYVNSKFVYVEKHIRNQMTTLYYNVMQQRCELEAEVLRNTLSFATLLPDEFAYRLMKEPGYMAVTAGEAIHVVKCIPVEVTARKTTVCYQELPVQVRNASLFLTPKSRILTKAGTQRECSHELPTLYRIEDIWVQLVPEPHIYPVPPQQLQPMTRITWKYLTPGPLADSGIYSNQDVNRLRDHIMFPAEKPALLNSIARGVGGYSTGGSPVPIQNLLDAETLEHIARSTAAKIWGGFITFGTTTAGILGIFIIIRVIKIIIDTAIHGYALYTIYGCSLHILGAIWSSMTHLLIHLAHPPSDRKKKPKAQKDIINNSENIHDPSAPVVITTQPQTQSHAEFQVTYTAPETAIIEPSLEYKALSKRLDKIEKFNP